MKSRPASRARPKTRRFAHLRRRWPIYAAIAIAVPLAAIAAVTVYYYATFSRVIDARLHSERERVLPRVFARPLEVHVGETLSERQLIDRLNDLGYSQRAQVEKPGEFAIGQNAVALIPREGNRRDQTIRIVFRPRPATLRKGQAPPPDRIDRLEVLGARPVAQLTLDPPMLTALISTGREKRRQVPLASIPPRMIQAVLAIEDHRFYDHPGVDVIRTIGALITNVLGRRPYLVGGSTITQQLVKNFFLTPEKSLRRKVLEQFMALVLERRASKDEILELYLNEVYLGQRGSFAVHGVAEAARLFFGKDVGNLTLSEAATIAGTIQSPYSLSPFANADRARERRNVVLRAMFDSGFIAEDASLRASREPLSVDARALEAEAPYFVDLVGETLAAEYPSALAGNTQVLDVYTTLDLHYQRLAQDAVRDGLNRVDQMLSRRRKRPPPVQGALIALDPRNGDILALVGGRSYNQTQFNRVTGARRQPGSVFKPFVYLAAFERAAAEGRADLTPASLVTDEPTTFTFEDKAYAPSNYENEYDGEITWRRALAMSRNVATVKVAGLAGYDRVAALWRRIDANAEARAYPSIALGAFEATPYEIASAYTLFPNGGRLRPLRSIRRIVEGDRDIAPPAIRTGRTVARPETTFLVTNMMRSVLNDGTGAGARAAGFSADAAGKSGTTNDLRDAWFVGFTPELLTVVWVGFDDNQPVGLSGTQAALPIWTAFMMAATTGRPSMAFEPPGGLTFADIDRDTGKLAAPGCPRVFREAFLTGTEPVEICDLHRY